MNKPTKKEKKAEQARMLAEMKAALEEAERAEQGEKEEKEEKSASAPTTAPVPKETGYHCRKCRAVMQNGVCPTCGFKMYVPMDEKKLGKIKLVLTVVGMAIFLAIFLYIQIKKG